MNDEPAARVAITNKQSVCLHLAGNAGTLGNAAGEHELLLVSGDPLSSGSAVRIISRNTDLQDMSFTHMHCPEIGWVYYDEMQDSGSNAEVQQWILSKTSAAGNSSGRSLCFGDTVVISNRYWKDSNLGFKGEWLHSRRYDRMDTEALAVG